MNESHQSPELVITRPPKERPVGVTILAVLFFIVGARYFFEILIIGSTVLRSLAGLLINPLAGIVVIVSLASALVQAALFVAIGIGLLKLQNWVRVLLIVLIGLVLLMAARALVISGAQGIVSSPGPVLIAGSIVVGVLVYLFRPHVKQAFGAIRF